MGNGQHVGSVSDAVTEDETRSAARAQQEALKRLAKPQNFERVKGGTTGDGDRCPLVPAHGRMLTIQGTQKQQCPNQDHDGRPRSHPDGAAPRTRAIWPLGSGALAEAVAVYTEQLPE